MPFKTAPKTVLSVKNWGAECRRRGPNGMVVQSAMPFARQAISLATGRSRASADAVRGEGADDPGAATEEVRG